MAKPQEEATHATVKTVSDCSDSDGAPEDVSLSRGREDALKARRVAAMESKRAASTLKERRRKREKLFTAQKAVKEEKKQLKRFPVSDLKEVLRMEADETKVILKSKVTKQKRQKAKKQTPTEHQFDSVKVVALEEGGGAPPVAPGRDSVLNFVEQQLYHSTRYKRVPILSFQAQRYTNRPARNFA